MNTTLSITASSLLTPLDDPSGRGDTWQQILAGQRITTRTAVADELLPNDPDLDRSIRLALAAIARLNTDVQNTHLFCGTSKGPITTFLAAHDALRKNQPLADSQARHIALGVGAMSAILRDKLKIRGPAHTSVAACSSGMHAFHRAVQAVNRSECDRALVVAADASLHPLFEGSFTRLGVLSPADQNGTRRCEPFSESGEGFFLVEAAAALVIERNASHGIAIEQTWIGGDSTGLIAIDEQTRTLRAALADVPRDIAFIHAHATGTAHDQYELAALRSLFPPTIPIFSHKKWLGHSLGAAGLVSLALTAQSHRAGRAPDGTIIPASSRSLTVAQGFGGHIALVTLRNA